MQKSTFSPLYRALREHLVGLRTKAGLSQRALAARMKREPSFIARLEQGERRLDLLEFYWLCLACNGHPETSASEVMRQFRTHETPEPFDRLPSRDVRPFKNAVPLYPLKAAAGSFTPSGAIDTDPEAWVRPHGHTRPAPGLFVARVTGRSMNRRIPDGAWCLFRSPVTGSRQGRVLLVQHRDIRDPDHGGRYTVKIYTSKKTQDPDGSWRHSEIVLKPDSSDPAFSPIPLDPTRADELRVIAELVEVLG